ncbi:hypothetical protein CYMTET_3070 [Cymbomonas tetramitiformis]|uniref:Uncharacterized protein n=1 Tax=Cymbomonas tetramitiformis TaxID=36881 RepID=A0AAE0F4U0_9CHLO|nr:hypothetical protein CYMTET_39103 [Cymbomonas tetramitiformis]KAK3289505.1 hypothetical protein CYMTET_3070 [Cymbomonas tetramitiformis]
MLPSMFQGTYEPESETDSVDTTTQSVWLDAEQVADMQKRSGQTVFLVRYRSPLSAALFLLGKCSPDRGKGLLTTALSSKQMHRYAFSAQQGQVGLHLPLGGQSVGCGGGLLGTIRHHLEGVEDADDLAAAIQRHVAGRGRTAAQVTLVGDQGHASCQTGILPL